MSKSASQYMTHAVGRVSTAQPSVKTVHALRKSIVKQQFQEGWPLRYALPSSVLLVILMTWGLFHLQTMVVLHDHVPRIRPFGIGYLIPVILMTIFAKRRAGWFTLILAVFAMAFALISPALSWQIHNARDSAELILLLIVGCMVINGVDAMQQNRMMFADVTDTPQAREISDAVRRAACAVPSVGDVHACVLRRRGYDIYVDLDFYFKTDATAEGVLTPADASQVVAVVENAIYQSHPLIFQVRARYLTPTATLRDTIPS